MWRRLKREIFEFAHQHPATAAESYHPIEIHFVSREKPLAKEEWSRALDAGSTNDIARIFAAARAGDSRAQLASGRLLLAGHGVSRDAIAALGWFRAAADQGHSEAANMVGRCYELGWGAEVDPVRAARWYRQAADAGDAWGQFNLAMMLFDGLGCRIDRKAALVWFVRAGRHRHAKAMNMIGRYREEGWEGTQRMDSAMKWYRRAAEGGDFRGQFNYGRLLFATGLRDEALRWIANGIEGGIPVFCRNVAAVLCDHRDADLRALGACALAKANGADIDRGIPLALANRMNRPQMLGISG
jgi:TPR repeat protein